jgi:hypothetical protein
MNAGVSKNGGTDEQNIEIDRTTLKADLVYNIQYRGNPHILNKDYIPAGQARSGGSPGL